MSTYKTIVKEAVGEFKDKGSKFLGYVYPVLSENDIKMILEKIREIHPKATHHCYAYRLGFTNNNYRANDDGEPSGSAGRPILGQIDSLGLTNVLAVVVRYYGGTKLGVSGLINAYREGAAEAFRSATVEEKDITSSFELTCDYANMNEMLNFVKRLGINIVAKDFDELCTIQIVLKLDEADAIIQQINENYKFECEIRKFE